MACGRECCKVQLTDEGQRPDTVPLGPGRPCWQARSATEAGDNDFACRGSVQCDGRANQVQPQLRRLGVEVLVRNAGSPGEEV